ncbi:hypothetical protein DBR06_SOUSAS11710026 [Sousa chinensis]|nr:hypothetical protein DBR06_SOUSAS11710026 [Sousa chinensis]
MRDHDDQYELTEDTRQLGLVVCRGTSVVLICPQDGMKAIPNPSSSSKMPSGRDRSSPRTQATHKNGTFLFV